jgi:hypothetical protein
MSTRPPGPVPRPQVVALIRACRPVDQLSEFERALLDSATDLEYDTALAEHEADMDRLRAARDETSRMMRAMGPGMAGLMRAAALGRGGPG